MSQLKGSKIKELQVSDLNLSLIILDLEDKYTLKKYLDLFEACFGKRANIDEALFSWLNNEVPNYKNINFAFLDNTTNELICAYGLQPGDAFINNSIVKYALCTNVMSHPNYGGKGLFVTIGKEALEYVQKMGVTFCFGLPNDKAVPGHLKVGWQIVNDLPFYQRTFNENERLDAAVGIETDFVENISDADLFSLYNDKYSLYFMRTAAMLKWRRSKPLSNYISFGINNEKEKGFIVLKDFTDMVTGVKKLHLVDFGYSNLECLSKLIDHCLYIAQNKKSDLLNLWHYPFNEMETSLLISKGFKPADQKNPVIIHTLGKKLEIPSGNWHITLFDNDVY